ncbi:hypothetical protein M0R45_007654 [Rubus argutus]|uniref:KIB1-4 beta-propeller domain-containing protein n=1 Tax=Rubus argutus TaxID=59490 RepID=A0AAW1XZA9_RUBAR
MEKILQRLTKLGDLIRLSIACKSWRSIVMRRDIRAAAPPLFPWLLLPPQSPNCSKKYLIFCAISEGRSTVDLKLPKRVRGGWIYGSSKGWLIIIKEKGINSKMFLLNPITRALHHLPSLRTIPFFKEFVKTRKWERLGAKEFCCHVALSTPEDINNSSRSFTVAAVFNDRKTLGLCRPGDKAWTVTQVLDDVNEKASGIGMDDSHRNSSSSLLYSHRNSSSLLFDILFSSGTLYALVSSQNKDGVVDSATRTLNVGFGHHAVELKLKLVYDKLENKNKIIDKQYRKRVIVSNATYNSILLESTSNEVLLIHQMLDYSLKTVIVHDGEDGEDDDDEGIDQDDNGDEANYEDYINNNDSDGDKYIENDDIDQEGNNMEAGNDENEDDITIDEDVPGFYPHLQTRSFRAYKINQDNDNFLMLQNLGDQILFCGNDGSFSLPFSPFKESEDNNTIYFARNSVWDCERAPETYTSREIGFFNLDKGRGLRFPTNRDISVRYQGSWFTPKL